ncbi:MAG TPA: tetratricopeptide repeat protein, partial [Candidatus Goldiibacteriota bacterium]|nr:tetratricopeptide repeat protein [Candidatus Goldiibacteriota bacterium]
MRLKPAVLMIILCAAVTVTVSAEDDRGKEISKDWEAAITAYKAAPDAPETIERMNNFAERWKNSNKFEASRAKYLNADIFYKAKKYQQAFDAYKKVVDEFGSSTYADSAMYRMGECLYNMGKYTEAIEMLTNFRFKFSSSVFHMEAVYTTALSYLNLLEYKKADRELAQFLEKNPFYAADEKVKLIGGIIDFYLERYDASAEKLKRIKTDAAYYYLGHSLTKSGKYLEAATAFKKLGEEFKTSKYLESAQYNKAEAFYKGLNFPVAAADYKTFMLRFPSSELAPYASLKYASTLFNDRKFREAAKAYENVLSGGGDARVKAYARYLSGECFRNLNDNAGALAAYEKVINEYPTVYDALASAQLRAGWCYLNLGKYDKAEEVLSGFTQKFTTHDDIATGYYLLGNANYNKQQYDQAIARYRFILEKFNYGNISEAALLMMALSYYNQKQYDMLATEVAHSLNQLSAKFKDPEGKKLRARSYFYLGQAYFKTGLFGPAASAFKTILDDYYESDITNEARANLAWCYYELENFQGARTMARDVINSNLQNTEVKNACEILIAHSYFSEKKFETAIQKYTEFAYAHSKDKDGELTAEALFQKGKAQEIMEAYGDA